MPKHGQHLAHLPLGNRPTVVQIQNTSDAAHTFARSNGTAGTAPGGVTAAHMAGGPEFSPWQGMTGCAAGSTMFINGADLGPGVAGAQCEVTLGVASANTIGVAATDNGAGGGGTGPQLMSRIVVAAE